jgi:hypothetical protein
MIPLVNHPTTYASLAMENSVRIERVKKLPSYDAAFDHLANFYKRRKISHDRDSGEIVDLTGDDEESGERDEIMEEAGNGEEKNDTRDLEGDPCKFA